MSRCTASRTKRKPENTISDEPTTSRPSLSAIASRQRCTRSAGTDSPKNTTVGLSMPPQKPQSGTFRAASSIPCNCASPSGLRSPLARASSGFRSSRACCIQARDSVAPQSRQTTSASEPCSSVTARLPARCCSPSTFWVIVSDSRPLCSSHARARCASFGSAWRNRCQPKYERDQ